MSFGFSVSDFALVCKVIVDIRSTLDNARGSRAEYQELLHELKCLDDALQHLERLGNQDVPLATLESIKASAVICQRPLQEFLGRIKRYERCLGESAKEGALATNMAKLRWRICEQGEVRRLQTYLHVHVGIINTLLIEHNLSRTKHAAQESKRDRWHIRKMIESIHRALTKIHNNVVAQAMAVTALKSTVERMFQMVNGEIAVSLGTLKEAVASACTATQQMYAVVLEIRERLHASPDTRWTFFQDPLVVEDPYGYRFPVPSEYDYTLLKAVVTTKLQASSCSEDIVNEHFMLYYANISGPMPCPKRPLRPGGLIIVTILRFDACLFQIERVRSDTAGLNNEDTLDQDRRSQPANDKSFVLPLETFPPNDSSFCDIDLKNVIRMPLGIFLRLFNGRRPPSADEICILYDISREYYNEEMLKMMFDVCNAMRELIEANGMDLWESLAGLVLSYKMKLSLAHTGNEYYDAHDFYARGLLRTFAGHRSVLLKIGKVVPEACEKLGDDWAVKRAEALLTSTLCGASSLIHKDGA